MIEKLIAIDPGKTTGIARFDDGKLVVAEEVKLGPLLTIARTMILSSCIGQFALAIELPQVYPVARWKGDPNDLITVATQVGVIIGALYFNITELHIVKPHEWKGTTPKAISKERTLAKLSEKEIACITKKSSTHIMDAIGLGLWILKR